MAHVERCFMCFGNVNVLPNEQANNGGKLYKLCCKYLHYTITNKTKGLRVEDCFQDNIQSLQLCQSCFSTAGELEKVTTQLEFYQENVAELILMFSLRVLNRRSQFSSPGEISPDKMCTCDATLFPNAYFKTCSSNQTEFVSVSDLDTENYGHHTFEDSEPLPPSSLSVTDCEILSEEEIKCEINPLAICEDLTQSSQENEFSDTKTPMTTSLNDGIKLLPTVRLSRIEFGSGGNITQPQLEDEMTLSTVIIDNNVQNNSEIGDVEHTERVMGTTQGSISIQVRKGIKSRPLILQRVGKDSRIVKSRNNASRNEPRFRLKATALGKNAVQCSICQQYLANRFSLNRHFKRYHTKEERNLPENDSDVEILEIDDNCSITISKNKGRMQIADPDFILKATKARRLPSQRKSHFQCRICRKTFEKSFTLIRHMRYVHENKRPFSCHLCQNRFQFSYHLESHLQKIHGLEKPYTCEKCEYSTTKINNLQVHRKSMHSDEIERFKCRDCGIGFDSPVAVENHYKKEHFALDFSEDCVVTSAPLYE